MLVFTQMLETADERLKMEQIFHTYGNLMFHVANKILNNDHDAEDAVQQALFSIYQNLGKFSEIKCPQSRSFIVTIALRVWAGKLAVSSWPTITRSPRMAVPL